MFNVVSCGFGDWHSGTPCAHRTSTALVPQAAPFHPTKCFLGGLLSLISCELQSFVIQVSNIVHYMIWYESHKEGVLVEHFEYLLLGYPQVMKSVKKTLNFTFSIKRIKLASVSLILSHGGVKNTRNYHQTSLTSQYSSTTKIYWQNSGKSTVVWIKIWTVSSLLLKFVQWWAVGQFNQQ